MVFLKIKTSPLDIILKYMKIKYGFYAIITLVLMLSCDKNIEETPQKIALKNIDPKKYTKIECPFEIDMDTIKNEKITIFGWRGVGEFVGGVWRYFFACLEGGLYYWV